jgi:hypothetical protein
MILNGILKLICELKREDNEERRSPYNEKLHSLFLSLKVTVIKSIKFKMELN